MKKKPCTCTVRKAGFSDCDPIYRLIKRNPRELVPRSINDIVQNIDRFLVAEDRGKVVGTVSWAILPEIGKPEHPTVEIKSVAVERSCRKRGVGRALVEAAIKRVRELKPEQVIVLTFTPKFFRKFGFAEVPKAGLMHKLYLGCLNCTKYDSPLTCPEVAMSLAVAKPERRH
ncbi:MAG: GNAT family N-acetyltransferase [Kiritimatiellae bacterium]|nr:GNAT family N-acetyltransferase [Kiritimatiellia bacterium]